MKKHVNDPVYFDSLNVAVDSLFAAAAKQRMTWEDMAENSGLSCSTIHKLGERVTKYPQFRTILLLARAVGGRLTFVEGTQHRKVVVKWKPQMFSRKHVLKLQRSA